MGFEGKQLMPEVAGKLMLLLIVWAVTAVVTCFFAPDTFNAARDYIQQASEDGNSIIPLLSAVLTVALLYLVAAFQKSPNRFRHAAEYMAEIADDLGSALFLLGWSILIVYLASPTIEKGWLAAFSLFVGIALVVASKRFGA